MGDRRIGVIINAQTGRHGDDPDMANLLAIAAEGGSSETRERRTAIPRGGWVGPRRTAAATSSRRPRQAALDHEVEEGHWPVRSRIFMDCAATAIGCRLRPAAIASGTHITSKRHAPDGRRAMDSGGLAARDGRRMASSRTSCSCPASTSSCCQQVGSLRRDAVKTMPARGFRRDRHAMPAQVRAGQLPQERGRRAGARSDGQRYRSTAGGRRSPIVCR